MDELCGGCQEQLDRLTKERDEARAGLAQFGIHVVHGETGLEFHVPNGFPGDRELAALRAAIEPTAANVQAYVHAGIGYKMPPDERVRLILDAIAERAKGEG